ncbi:hypothetical protein SAMN05421594_2353 [Chryseobacterium oleae]|uniref:Uncharacterized protein n=1 Tax=Chryseobacterium oleae TaxID=491207 RepID=A0A1I4YE47_CHROL|nr:hypothetical protein [Chryseobacterium oleae]SFN36315.1 hypothetical protein SAMN05421594_2353 [Chryseobacterium oleae]
MNIAGFFLFWLPTFANDITAFTRSFTKAKNKQDVIDNFIKMMKDTYGITVTFRD